MSRLLYQVYVGPRSKLYDFCTESVAVDADRNPVRSLADGIHLQ